MFKIKGFSLFCLFILLLVYQPLAAQNKDSVKCYGVGQEVLDRSIPCCEGLDPLTEMDTKKVFCDKKPGSSSAYFAWGLILIFPLFLLVFVIFGIRNKMAHRKNKLTE
jgi:hypothetical protein